MSNTNTSFASLTTSFTTFTSEFICSTCQKRFKKQSGLLRHLNIVKKYNIPCNNLDNLSETNNEKFRSILVYLIHRKLPHGFKKRGHQLVSLACTEHQSAGYQILSEILNNPLWGQKFYDNEQQTYVVLFSDPLQHLKNNLLAIATHCIIEGVNTKRHKSKYNPGEVVVE
ncbi:hypothetical protein RirG_121080 [Rhizophagus irregularis DAOM 197198w]|uniref:C2H2-type domain-containing protein n=1 Tax=Rhizophagus irregularis (strain DAOM 197198w) TaxID=1432141 RepID=A0A015MIQ8_RHIIW|nr:hypothetical protein RirG_121080 [Rhizophagus irregularis DAOM 197198w]